MLPAQRTMMPPQDVRYGKPFKKEAADREDDSEAAMDKPRDATQIHGGYGFMNEYPVRVIGRQRVLEIA